MMDFLRRCIKRQLSLSHLFHWLKLFLSFLGTYYAILKICVLLKDANPDWTKYCELVGKISGEWVIWEIVVLFLLTIIIGWKRIRTVYILKSGQKIVFDYCSIMKQKGEIMIEVPNSFTTGKSNIDNNSKYAAFLAHYREINKSEALFEIIKKDLKAKLFKPEKTINAHKDQERYDLGSFCKICFDGKNYLLVASYKTDTNHRIISTIDDYNVFLCNMWANLSKIEPGRNVLDIPIFGEYGQPYSEKLTTDKKIYHILKTYIYNAKKNAPCAKELHVCFYDDRENETDLDRFVTIAKYIDEFRTEEYDDKIPQGTGLES